tara:strand:+ start:8813 stop:9409 length:597 start_codon:yes stop_codon:yes gene_type:complete
MTRNPIQQVSNKLQNRAIGIIFGEYKPLNEENINKGSITDKSGNQLDAVVLGKTIPLIKKYVDLKKSHYWIVYPRNKNTEKLHLQISGIWDPNNLNKEEGEVSKNNEELLNILNLKDNFFSIRGTLIYVNSKAKEIVLKIKSSYKFNKQNNNSFKISLKGEISRDFINTFVSVDASREGNALNLTSYEVIEGKSLENN